MTQAAPLTTHRSAASIPPLPPPPPELLARSSVSSEEGGDEYLLLPYLSFPFFTLLPLCLLWLSCGTVGAWIHVAGDQICALLVVVVQFRGVRNPSPAGSVVAAWGSGCFAALGGSGRLRLWAAARGLGGTMVSWRLRCLFSVSAVVASLTLEMGAPCLY